MSPSLSMQGSLQARSTEVKVMRGYAGIKNVLLTGEDQLLTQMP